MLKWSRKRGTALQTEVTLSVVVITRNEEVDLPGFLENFAPLADEIVIIDDGSTDKSAEIARAAGSKVRFIQSPRSSTEGFCDQRQKGVQAARGQWLLQVDADMRVTPELAAEINAALDQDRFDAFRFRLQQYWMNRPVRFGGFQYWNQHWFARRAVVAGWGQKVHEQLVLTVPAHRIGQFNARMHHLNDLDFSERLRKNHQYSMLEVARLLDRGERFPVYKLILIPISKFIISYFLMQGFRDGRVGLVWAFYQMCGTATIYFLGWSRVHGGNRERLENEISRPRVAEPL